LYRLPHGLTNAFLTLLAGPADITEGAKRESDLEALCISVGSALVQTVSKTRHTASIAITPGCQGIDSCFYQLRSRSRLHRFQKKHFKKPIKLSNLEV